MYIESQAVLGAMIELMGQGTPSLSVHDSLIVPVYERSIAANVLSEQYRKATGVLPVLSFKLREPSEPAASEDFDTFHSADDLTEDNACEENDSFRDAESHSEASSDEWDWPSHEKKEKTRRVPLQRSRRRRQRRAESVALCLRGSSTGRLRTLCVQGAQEHKGYRGAREGGRLWY